MSSASAQPMRGLRRPGTAAVHRRLRKKRRRQAGLHMSARRKGARCGGGAGGGRCRCRRPGNQPASRWHFMCLPLSHLPPVSRPESRVCRRPAGSTYPCVIHACPPNRCPSRVRRPTACKRRYAGRIATRLRHRPSLSAKCRAHEAMRFRGRRSSAAVHAMAWILFAQNDVTGMRHRAECWRIMLLWHVRTPAVCGCVEMDAGSGGWEERGGQVAARNGVVGWLEAVLKRRSARALHVMPAMGACVLPACVVFTRKGAFAMVIQKP